MDRFKRKFGLILFVGICMFATTFGMGMNSLVNALSVVNTASASTSVEDESMDDETSGFVADQVYDNQYLTGVSSLTLGTTTSINNSLIEFSGTNLFGDTVSGKTIQVTNSIFVYTGTGTAKLYNTITNSNIHLENVVFFSTKGNVSFTANSAVTTKGFYYSSKNG